MNTCKMNLFVNIFLVFLLHRGILCLQITNGQLNSSNIVGHTPQYIGCPTSEFCANGGTCYMEVNKKFPLYLCKCPEKYYGETCQFRRVDHAKTCQPEIADNFCVNHGTCYEDTCYNETIYYCECPEKFWGSRCESISPGKIELCPPTLDDIFCKNGGTCYESTMDEETYHFCVCRDGYIGLDCDFKVVEDNSSVILNELLCLNEGACDRVMWADVEIFGCSCQKGFYGDRCEYSTSATSSLCSAKDAYFCMNGGTCYQEILCSKRVFLCTCMTGYTGQRCEISLSNEPQLCHDLDDKFCANGGTCFEVHYLETTLHYCECTYQFGGTRCEKKLPRYTTCPPPLDKETCENNGTCLTIDTGREEGAYMCKCVEGYYGATCEYRLLSYQPLRSECPEAVLEFLCLNGGTCYKKIIMNRPFYYCECVKPFQGVRCEINIIKWLPCPSPLDTKLCLRGGVCSQVATHYPSIYICRCKSSYGARCEHCAVGLPAADHPCPPPLDKVLCKNGGICVTFRINPLISTFFCSCPEGLFGASCEYPYSFLPIKKECPSEMEKTFCLHGGTCYKENFAGHTIYMCDCDYPYTGERCQLMSIQKLNCPQEFSNILCLNSGSCTYRKSNGYKVYLCDCTEGHYGARCEHTFRSASDNECPDDFQNTFCKNGGVCTFIISPISPQPIYYCKCVGGFFGVSCEYSHSSIESTSVACPPDITDKYCENGGTCYTSRLMGDPVYHCHCPDAYHGVTCEFAYPSTKCPRAIAQLLCLHGTCFRLQSNGIDTYHCVCYPDFYGDRCEHDSNVETSTSCFIPFSTDLCKNNGTCVRLGAARESLVLHYCKCPEGFYGTVCEQQYHFGIDKFEPCRLDVAQSYCLNGGSCYRNSWSVSFCECAVPYYGARCEYKLSFNTPCVFPFSKLLCVQGHCITQVSHGHAIYSCFCLEGFYGSRCEHKLSEGSHHESCPHPLENELCGNGGTCVTTVFNDDHNLYYCRCKEGYYGMSCEYMKPLLMGKYCPTEIATEWCLHGGTCFLEYVMNHLVYRCACTESFYGARCEKHFFTQPYCPASMQKNLCYNGGSCIPITVGGYNIHHCKCLDGYYGSRCEYCHEKANVGLCPSHLNTDLCKNGGTCITITGTEGENLYYCKCPVGLYGLSCEFPYPHLASVGRPCPACIDETYCLHGGSCYRVDIMGNSTYHCECVYPYVGERCDVKYPQQSNCPNQFNYFLCLNSGKCVETKSNGYKIYTCVCQDGYYGPRCEHTCGEIENPVELCEDPFNRELCKNGGTCISLKFPGGNELLFCKCRPGLFGISCEYPFLPLMHASTVCPPDVEKYFCLNGGICYMDIDPDDTFYYCKCPATYFGERCELNFAEQIICPSFPFTVEHDLCLNGGTCVIHRTHGHHIYHCQCAEGYYGPRCEHYNRHPQSNTCPSPMDSVYCMNGGTCAVFITGKDQQVYFCICPEGYYGIICEYKIPPATPVGEYCPPVLATNWCLNGGTCYKASILGVTVYYCHCVESFYGDRCEIEFSGQLPCPQLLDKFLCLNGGVCTKRILQRRGDVLYYCDCPIRYSGPRCENAVEQERKVKYCTGFKWFCLNGGVCLQEVIGGILHCDCKQGFYGERCQIKARFSVACPPEYHSHICFHGGVCMIGSTPLRKIVFCVCQAGYLGQQCEFTEPKIKPTCPTEVSEFLCLNGGTCFEETIGKQRLYYCECQQLHFGLRCEYKPAKYDSCDSTFDKLFCLNGGTCHSFGFSNHTVYFCLCDSDYHGSLCQYPLQEPVSETLCPPEISEWFCYNGGTCFKGTVNNNADYYCICLKGILGHRCEYIAETAVPCLPTEQSVFCKNHGTCNKLEDIHSDYFCVCPHGYGGRRCDYINHRIDKCPIVLEPSLCLNNGNCSVLIFVGYVIYYCECPIGFYGPRCQHIFPAPIREKTCPEHIDKHFCLNSGTCRQTVSQKLVINYCVCVDGYYGEKCEFSYREKTNCSDVFNQFYCLNGGTCYKLTVGKEIFHHCECLRNFFGPRCESQFPVPGPESEQCVGEIATYFCLNGGTCHQIVVDNEVFYFCTCPEGWTGLRCEDGPITKQMCPTDLQSIYCLNNGTCIKLLIGSEELYYCICVRGFEGPRCEYNLPNSDSRPCSSVLAKMYCLNGGTCSEMTVLDEVFYMCDCPEKFWGKQCEFRTFIRNFCPRMLDISFCLNGGTCYQILIDDKDLYYCVCTNIYYGKRCENSYLARDESQPCRPEISTQLCLNGGLCYELIDDKVFYCECVEGYSGKRCEHKNVGHLHISYLKMQNSLERSSCSKQVDICFFLLLLWFTLLQKYVLNFLM